MGVYAFIWEAMYRLSKRFFCLVRSNIPAISASSLQRAE